MDDQILQAANSYVANATVALSMCVYGDTTATSEKNNFI